MDNVTPSGDPMKFSHFFGMVAPIVHTTQQKFLIGLFAKSDTFHWSMTFSMISQPISAFTKENFNHIYFLYIRIHCASHISCMNPWAYAAKGTIQWGEMPRNPDTLHL